MVDGASDPLDSRTTCLFSSRERYVCVEPGHVQDYVNLPVGETWVGRQILRSGW